MKELTCGFFGSSGEVSLVLQGCLENLSYDVKTFGTSKKADFYCDIKDSSTWPTKLEFDLLVVNSWIMKPRNLHHTSLNRKFGEFLINKSLETGADLIFVSSMSASENAKSNYGQSKFEVEKLALAKGKKVLKPGLIVIQDKAGSLSVIGSIRRTLSFGALFFKIIDLNQNIRIPVVALSKIRSDFTEIILSKKKCLVSSISEYLPIEEIIGVSPSPPIFRLSFREKSIHKIVKVISWFKNHDVFFVDIADQILSAHDSKL